MAAIDVDDWLVEEQGSEVIKRLDESSVAVVEVDDDLVITYANQATVDLIAENLAVF